MAEDKIVSSMEEIDGGNDEEFAIIDGFKPGEKFRIGSLTAGDMIEWSEAGEDKEKKRVAGLRMICMSLVGPEPHNKRYAAGTKEQVDANIAKFRKKSHKTTENMVKAILKLNGMRVKGDSTEAEDAAKKG